MSIVVDASVLVSALVDSGPEGAWSEDVLKVDSLVAPQLALAEAANILRRFELAQRLTAFETASAHRDLLRLKIDLVPYHPFAGRIWELRANLTAYDAWYIATAEAIGLPLATLDRRLPRAPGPTCRFLVPEPASGD